MPIPEFTTSGDLPAGVHLATLSEVIDRFGLTPSRRQTIATRLERIYRVANGAGPVARFVVFGSFITSKAEPNDVDIFMIMEDSFDLGAIAGEARLLFDHGAADTFFGASIFWIRRLSALGGEQAAIEYWQIKRDGTTRGIVEIVEGQP